MNVLRPLIAVAGLLGACHLASAQAPPAWQPYRAPAAQPLAAPLIAPQAAPLALATQQLATPAQYLVAAPHVDPLTDAELDRFCREGYACPPCESCFDPNADPMHDPLHDPVVAWQQAQRAPARLELLPGDLIWHSYWAGAQESRTSATLFQELGDDSTLLDVSLGGRTALLRNASRTPSGGWMGWELQLEGAALLRHNLDENWDFDAGDFRVGVPLIWARDQLQWKLAYYHLSSHIGDEFLERNPAFTPLQLRRDVLVLGASATPLPAVRLYGEAGWAFYDNQGAHPWELQFGCDLARPGPTGRRGTPFAAVNAHLREEFDFGGNLAVQAGWLWRGRSGRVLRTGLHYYNGKSSQYEFFDHFEQQLGLGLWQEY